MSTDKFDLSNELDIASVLTNFLIESQFCLYQPNQVWPFKILIKQQKHEYRDACLVSGDFNFFRK